MTRRAPAPDPFRALGLERRRDLADDDIRAAWRRVAAATHPDRSDGGDPVAFAAAAAAYTALRTASSRSEALADLLAPGGTSRVRAGRPQPKRLPAGRLGLAASALAARVLRGRPLVLALRLLAAAAAGVIAVQAAGWRPASAAILVGLLTWLGLTAGSDLAPPPGSP